MKKFTFQQFKNETNIIQLLKECSDSENMEITDAHYRVYYDQVQNSNYWCQTLLANLEIIEKKTIANIRENSQATQECDSTELCMSEEAEDFPN